MWQAEFNLYLYPDNSNDEIDAVTLTLLLKKMKFIDQRLTDHRFSTGNEFVSLLTFMGCSPNIELEPQEDSAYCYIEIYTSNKQQFISGKNTKVGKCPYCKEAMPAFLNKVAMRKTTNFADCPLCNKAIELQTLNWRKSAFLAKSWICIGNIYELEAIASDQLLTALENETNVTWKTAYIRQEKNNGGYCL